MNCVTHKSNAELTFIELVWKAPPSIAIGDVIIREAIVENFDNFWANETQVIKSNIPTDISFPQWKVSQRNGYTQNALNEQCGKTKGCMLWPKTCSGEDCTYAVTFKEIGDDIEFEMVGPKAGYLSLSFSDDLKMGDDETISCALPKNSENNIQHGYNPMYYNERIRHTVLSNVSMTVYNGVNKMYCTFRRPKYHMLSLHHQRVKPTVYVSKNRTFDLSQKYYVVLGWGPLYAGSDSMAKHEQLPIISPHRVNLLSLDVIYANAIPLPVQAHSSMMLIAWMLLAGFAMVVSRYYKDTLNQELFGIKSWFQVHRAVMFITVALTTAGFILIFIHVNGWREVATLHAAFGIAVMALAIFQILVALCRPSPDSSKRIIFNWYHRISGVLSHICAVVSMLLGINLPLMPTQMQDWQTKLIIAWICVQVVWVVIFEVVKYRNSSGSKKEVYDLDTVSNGITKSKKSNDEKKSFIPTILLVLYAITMLGFLAAALTFIFIF